MLKVFHLVGRPGQLTSDVHVWEDGKVRLRFDSDADPEFWLEATLEPPTPEDFKTVLTEIVVWYRRNGAAQLSSAERDIFHRAIQVLDQYEQQRSLCVS